MLQPENSSAPLATSPGKVFSDLRAPQVAATNQKPLVTAPGAPVAPPAALEVSPKPSLKPATRPNPAGGFHTGKSATPASTLDLRDMKLTSPEQVQPPKTSTLDATVARAPSQGTTSATPTLPLAIISPSSRTKDRLLNAGVVAQSATISKFGQIATVPSGNPIAAPTAASPLTLSGTLEATPPSASRIGQITLPQPRQQAPNVANQLPNSVVTQIQSLSMAAGPATAAQNALSANVQPATILKPTFKPSSIVAVVAAIAIMVGYTWVNNYPKMTVKTAAAKAGIEASLPSYVPSNYSLASQVSFAPGEVTLNLHNTQSGSDIAIKQRRTSWDSSSLLENFVTKDTSLYSSVQGQGLTIYLFDKNKASWVNHGIWYSIDGNDNLTRDQLLKIAYSL